MTRIDRRDQDQLRPVTIETGVQEFAEGSVMISTGKTSVLCAVSVENRVPPFLRGQGKGWITADQRKKLKELFKTDKVLAQAY